MMKSRSSVRRTQDQEAVRSALLQELEKVGTPASNPPYLTESQLRARLSSAIREAGSQKAFAELHGISTSVLSDALIGNRDVPASVAAALGFFRRHVFLPARTTIRKEIEREISA